MKLTGEDLTKTLGNIERLNCADLNTGFTPLAAAVITAPTQKPTLGLDLS